MIDIAHKAVVEQKAIQKPEELAELLGIVAREQPWFVIEIGSAAGGTLWAWRQALPDSVIVSIDADHQQVATSNRDGITMLTGDSHDPEILGQVKDMIAAPGFVFIDADHTYNGVRTDFEMYGSLVRPGGLIAIHDIVTDTCQVPMFWQEIRRNYVTLEIVASEHEWSAPSVSTQNEKWGGIGIVRVS